MIKLRSLRISKPLTFLTKFLSIFVTFKNDEERKFEMSEDFRIKLRLQLRKASVELTLLSAGLKGMDQDIIEKRMKDFGFKYVDLFSKTIENIRKED